MLKHIVTIMLFVFLTGCSAVREQERRDTLAGMSTDQKVDYLAQENEDLNHRERTMRHKMTMLRFFPHMFYGR